MIVLKIILAALSLFVIFATALVLGLVAAQSEDIALLGDPGPHRLAKAWSIAVGAGAFLGTAICIYAGVEKLLWWLPRSWGGYDEDGNWTWMGESLAGVLAFMGAAACASIVSAKVAALVAERRRAERAKWERRHNAGG